MTEILNPAFDPLLTEETDRNTLLPLRYPQIFKEYEKQRASYWLPHEIDLTRDKADWDTKLTTDEQNFIKMVLAFFASSDIIVNENIEERFKSDLKVMEAKVAYTFQSMMENIHSEMYSLLIDTYITNLQEKVNLINAVQTNPTVAKKAAWAKKWIDSDRPYAERLVAFAAVEGIFFSGSFCSIYWLKSRGLLPGLCDSNDFIARDEGSHVDFAVLIHSMLQQKVSLQTLHQIISEAVAIEIEFIQGALPNKLVGMNKANMKKYVTYVANRLVKQFGYAELYPSAENPFPFMDAIALSAKSNFFEKRPTQYNRMDNEKKKGKKDGKKDEKKGGSENTTLVVETKEIGRELYSKVKEVKEFREAKEAKEAEENKEAEEDKKDKEDIYADL